MRSEVADVTGIFNYIGKSIFRHQNVGVGEGGGSASQIFVLGEPTNPLPPPPTPPPMKWDIQNNQKAKLGG